MSSSTSPSALPDSMLVTNAQDLQVTGLFTAYRFGELGLALGGPLPVPTSVFAPGTPEAAALTAENAAKELFVNDRNEAFSQFQPLAMGTLRRRPVGRRHDARGAARRRAGLQLR